MAKFLMLGLLFFSQSVFAGIAASQGVDAYLQAPQVKTYSVTSRVFSPPANATDMCVIGGISSANSKQVVKVHHVRVFGVQSTGGVDGFYLIKRSSFDTGPIASGTGAFSAVPHDSASVAPGADLALYTANPTLGTQVGFIRGADVFIGATTGLSTSSYDFDLSPHMGVIPPVLHANEQLALSFNGNTVNAGLAIQCEFTWSEEP